MRNFIKNGELLVADVLRYRDYHFAPGNSFLHQSNHAHVRIHGEAPLTETVLVLIPIRLKDMFD